MFRFVFLALAFAGLVSSTGCITAHVDLPGFVNTFGPSYLRGKSLIVVNSVSPEISLRIEIDGCMYRPRGWDVKTQGEFLLPYGRSATVVLPSHFYDRGSDRSVVVKGVDSAGNYAGFQERMVFTDPNNPSSENWVVGHLNLH